MATTERLDGSSSPRRARRPGPGAILLVLVAGAALAWFVAVQLRAPPPRAETPVPRPPADRGTAPGFPVPSALSAKRQIEAKTWDSWWVRVSREIERRRAAGEDLEDLEAQLLHVATQREALRTKEAELLATGEADR